MPQADGYEGWIEREHEDGSRFSASPDAHDAYADALADARMHYADIAQDERDLGQFDLDQERVRRLRSAHHIFTTLLTAAEFDRDAKTEGSFMAPLHRRAADALRASLAESEWVALLRAAVISLGLAVEGGEFAAELIGHDLDRLSDLLRRIEDGEV